jgi:hypothetical protein
MTPEQIQRVTQTMKQAADALALAVAEIDRLRQRIAVLEADLALAEVRLDQEWP